VEFIFFGEITEIKEQENKEILFWIFWNFQRIKNYNKKVEKCNFQFGIYFPFFFSNSPSYNINSNKKSIQAALTQ